MGTMSHFSEAEYNIMEDVDDGQTSADDSSVSSLTLEQTPEYVVHLCYCINFKATLLIFRNLTESSCVQCGDFGVVVNLKRTRALTSAEKILSYG